jgi:hypothetical protein
MNIEGRHATPQLYREKAACAAPRIAAFGRLQKGEGRIKFAMAATHDELCGRGGTYSYLDLCVKRFSYTGLVVHFLRTSLPLDVDHKSVKGAVYQAVEKPEYFYVARGDAMLKLDTKWAYSPGVGGFSMHAPKVNAIRWSPTD